MNEIQGKLLFTALLKAILPFETDIESVDPPLHFRLI